MIARPHAPPEGEAVGVDAALTVTVALNDVVLEVVSDKVLVKLAVAEAVGVADVVLEVVAEADGVADVVLEVVSVGVRVTEGVCEPVGVDAALMQAKVTLPFEPFNVAKPPAAPSAPDKNIVLVGSA